MRQRTESTGGAIESGDAVVVEAITRLGAVKPVKPGAEVSALSQTTAAAGALVLPALTPVRRRRRVAFKAAAVLSVFLHAGSLYAFLTWHGTADPGALERPSDAISVEIVESRTLEAIHPKQTSETAASPEDTAPVEGKTEASDANPVQPETKEPAEPGITVPQPPVVVPDMTEEVMRAVRQEPSSRSEAPPVPVAGPTEAVPPPPKSGDDEDNAAAKRKIRREPEKRKAAEPAPKGGTTSKASSGKGKGGERASASTGSILGYAAHVRARVAGNKPAGGGLRGTAVVSFGVTPSGGLAYAAVGRSSGSPQLDRLAIAAVRSAAPFPTPPAGATPGQLRFTIPFHFQ